MIKDEQLKTILRAAPSELIDFDAIDPGLAHLIEIYQKITGSSDADMRAEFQGKTWAGLRGRVLSIV